jgi:hypothetical protein
MVMNSFNDMVLHFRDRRVVTSTKQSLDELIKLSYFIANGYHDGNVVGLPPRVFLASYMVSYNPTNVFEQTTPEVTALKDASDKMTAQFKTMSEALLLIQGPEDIHAFKELSKDFYDNAMDYNAKFTIWKRLDEVFLSARINRALGALLLAMFHLAGQALDVDILHDGTDPLLLQIKAQINRLRTKLGQIAGNVPVAEFDARMAAEMQTYRQLRILREEQRRQQHGDESGFDFLES